MKKQLIILLLVLLSLPVLASDFKYTYQGRRCPMKSSMRQQGHVRQLMTGRLTTQINTLGPTL